MNKKIIINYICEVNYPSTSAYGLHVLKMCDALSAKKKKINLFIPSLSQNKSSLKKNYNIKNKINFLSIFNKKIQMNFFNRFFFSIKIIKKNFNINNCIFISRSALFAILASIFYKKVILELHHELSGITKYIFIFFKKITLLKNLRYIFIHKNLIKKFEPPSGSYICLDDAVDINDYKLKKNLKQIKNTCVYVGSFYHGKGIEIILQIAKKLTNINFHIYGDKQFLLKKINLKNVKVFEYINYKNIPKTLSKYTIALMPYGNNVSGRLKSINLAESMSPMKMFDYLASSKIILASNLKVYNHILKHRYNAILIKHQNINDWINWILKVFKSKNNFNSLRRNAYKTALKYTWANRANMILKFSQKQFF